VGSQKQGGWCYWYVPTEHSVGLFGIFLVGRGFVLNDCFAAVVIEEQIKILTNYLNFNHKGRVFIFFNIIFNPCISKRKKYPNFILPFDCIA
jgi:hypothetical protein